MDHWETIRRQARALHRMVCRAAHGETSVRALLKAAAHLTQIQKVPLPAGDSLLDGGEAVLDRNVGVIWFNRDIEPTLADFYIAHEYAHFWLDGSFARCTRSDVDAESSEEPLALGVQRVEGYGPQERREREANVFAREFLLPADCLWQWYVVDGLDATEIAARTGALEGMVFHQLAQALLTPVVKDGELVKDGAPGGVPEPMALDPDQRAVVYAEHGPILVEAGPGTGKTRALVSRIAFLLRQGVEPSSILALTFSNKAAEEMRARLSQVMPDVARQIWMGTFHAFGLELLQKFGTWLGLPPRVSVIDPVDALFLLERMLPRLQLEYYQNLYEPTTFLRDLLAAISRAKDELVGCGEYTALAEQMRARAQTNEEQEAAAKALEVARVYTLYQEELGQKQLLDFGDLIFQAVTLLRSHPDIRTFLQRTYMHILVDEYQDVNRASGRLLQELAEAGVGLWVVGDIRQAIYRFRGAAPSNMRLFTEDFPHARKLSLRLNYRSQPTIVEVFTTLAPQMGVAQRSDFTPWESKRSDTGGRVLLEIAEDVEAEGVSLAREMARQRVAGITYREQAVLCRSHATLARIAALLEREGIPVLYLGNLFERPEVRDLLALVSLACEGDGHGLIRVARFAEYDIPLADVKALLAAARLHKKPFPSALSLAQHVESISPQGKRGLALLAGHLDGLCYGTSAWHLLVNYLFVRSVYLRTILWDASVLGYQRRLALFQFLQFSHEQGKAKLEDTEDPKRAFLRYVRRLEIFGEDKPLRQIPEWATDLDAVRLLTMHASKGLEFRVVYLPGLNQGCFPARRQWQPCPPPSGMMIHGGQDEHEEEEALFFVALSRARDVLYLSYARRIGNRRSQPSSLLALIECHLPGVGNNVALWEGSDSVVDVPATVKIPPLNPSQVFDVGRLDRYMSCPRQYYYEFVLDLGSRRTDSAYIQFHRCVYGVLFWLQDERRQGRGVDEDAAQRYLLALWEIKGPREHPYEMMYQQQAAILVTRAVRRFSKTAQRPAQTAWEVPLTYGRVRFTPDVLEIVEESAGPSFLIQRLRTGQISQSERDKAIYALYHRGAEHAYPGARCKIQLVSLTTDQVAEVNLSAGMIKTRLARYDVAMEGILQGTFPAQPNDRECPRCPHYFICPAAEER